MSGHLLELVRRDAYAEKTRLELADKAATYRAERDEARIVARTLAITLRAGDFSDADLLSALSYFGALGGRLPDWLTGTTPPDANTCEDDATPKPRRGEHGTCTTCGSSITYCGGGVWAHDTAATDAHNAKLGGPA
jgi:hypothetical protein